MSAAGPTTGAGPVIIVDDPMGFRCLSTMIFQMKRLLSGMLKRSLEISYGTRI